MIDAATERRAARNTALVVAFALGVIGAWQAYRGRDTVAASLAGIAIALVVCGLYVPRLSRAFHRAWMAAADILGYVNSRILLCLIYYGVVTPIGLLMRLMRHDPLDRRRGTHGSYWVPRAHTRQSKAGFERAF